MRLLLEKTPQYQYQFTFISAIYIHVITLKTRNNALHTASNFKDMTSHLNTTKSIHKNNMNEKDK